MNLGRDKGDEYYPLRWKLADFAENIIILYRTRAALVLAALGVLLILIGAFIVGWRPFSSDDADVVTDVTEEVADCLLYTSPSPRDQRGSRMPSSA